MFPLSRRNSNLRILFVGVLLLTASCSNLPFVKQTKAPTQVYLTDFSTAWTAALEAVSNGKDLVKSQNRETGIIESQWIDSSESRQFLDVFSDEDFFLRMRYRLRVQVREGKKNDQQAVMIRVIKQQQKENTFLGGFQEEETDGLEEAVYLYRIGRLIAIQQYNDSKEAENKTVVDDDETLLF